MEPSHLAAPSSAVGRGDYLRLMGEFGEEVADKIAPLLGLKAKESELPSLELSFQEKEESVSEEPEEKKSTTPVPKGPAGFEPWYLKRFEAKPVASKGVPAWYEALPALTTQELATRYHAGTPLQQPLLPWPTLWPFLRGALGAWLETGEVRVGRLIEALATGKFPDKIPRKTRLKWASQCCLILDLSPRLRPYHHDFQMLLPLLETLRGKAGFGVWVADKGCRPIWRRTGCSNLETFPLPEPGTPVLVLGDLGQYLPHKEEVARWKVLGRRLRQQGCLPQALVPCPRDQWDASLAAVWSMAVWDDADRLPAVTKGGFSPQTPRFKSNQALGKRDRLGELLSPAVQMEPALLRAARRLLNARQADVGSEYHLWNHPQASEGAMAVQLEVETRRRYLQGFSQFGEKLCDALLRELKRHHAWLSPATEQEEQVAGYSLLGKEFDDGDVYFKKYSKLVGSENDSLGKYSDLVLQRQDKTAWQTNPGLCIAFMKRYEDQIQRGEMAFPEGLDFETYRWVWGLEGPEIIWHLFWMGDGITFRKTEPATDEKVLKKGAPLTVLAVQAGYITHRTSGLNYWKGCLLQPGGVLPFPEEKKWTLRTHEGLWELARLQLAERPFWMTALGCDARGLFGELEDEGGMRKLYWLPPGPIQVADKDGKILGRWVLEHGTWMAEEQFPLFASRTFVQPDWCDGMGVDEWGIYADLVVKGVTQRFRWIWPGTFWMGSPEDEPGRHVTDKEEYKIFEETRHKVTLTQGFWLAQTTVSQGLWQVVMGKNPSYFKGQDLPVEEVSWDDCKKFLERLNTGKKELKLCLPSEAQWEYACRAGTETAFHFGTSIITEQVNYNGNYPLEGSPKGEYREKTVPVRALPGNAWGLLQMHGNVWEWCEDHLAAYAAGDQVDAVGPSSGAIRVLRGGSWIDVGRNCRSAYRGGRTPGDRNLNVGFRLARGQVALQQESKQSQGWTEDGDRPRSNPGRRKKP